MGAAEGLGSLFSRAASAVTEKLRTSEIGSQFLDTIVNQRNEFSRTPQGMNILGKMDKYTQLKNSVLSSLMKPVGEVKDAVKDDPTKLNATIGDLHTHLTGMNHPAAAHAASILNVDPEARDMSLKDYTQKARSQANLLAKTKIFGENSEHLVDDIMPLYDSKDPVLHSHADALLNILANRFHDTTFLRGTTASQTKLDVKKGLELINKIREDKGEDLLGKDLERFDTTHVYDKTNDIERFASRRARIFLAPMIAINHMSTFFNYSNAPLTAIMKAFTGMGDGEIQQLADVSGIFGSQMHHMIAEDIANRTGTIASKLGKPEVGMLLGKIFHNPGFDFVRQIQLKAGAIIGYHSLLHWTEGALRGDKRSILELKEMGLDVGSILERKGQLTDTEKAQAMFHFVNNRAFIDRGLDRSLTAQRNPWTRMLTMFHGYVTFQQKFMRRELQKMLMAGDYTGIARYAGTVGLLFPAVAPMIKSAETLARSASINQAGQSLQDDYNKIAHAEDPAAFMGEYLDLLSYFGSWGTLHSFITAAHGDRLALALMGPIAGSAARTGQDVVNFATKPDKGGHRNIRPLAKDVLQQTIPGVGNMLASHFFPKKEPKNQIPE